jgi:AraC-like DNA-binding protein
MCAFPRALDTGSVTNLDQYRDALAEAFVPLDATPIGDVSAFRGSVRARPIADLQLSIVTASSQIVRRTRSLVRRSAADVYKVGVQLHGHGVVQQDGRLAQLGPGDITVYDTARPYELTFEHDFEMLVLVVPRRRLANRAPHIDDLTAVTISGTDGTGSLASSLLRGLDPRSARPGLEATYLSDAAVDLLAASLAACTEPRPPEPAAETVVAAAQHYIEEHLTDHALSPAEVAAAAHVSLRHLQKLFERRGMTITGWIRERRLERCWHDLADPHLSQRSVAAIASHWGLVDPAQFSRLFRAQYGRTPREHRSALITAAG